MQNRAPLPAHPCQLLKMPWKSLCCGRWICSLETSALEGCFGGNILKDGHSPFSGGQGSKVVSPGPGLTALEGKAGGEGDKP